MSAPFIGSTAVASRRLTRHALRSRYTVVYPNVYLATGTPVTALTRARAAWLWPRGQRVLAGQSAAALHGARWIDAGRPAEINCANRRPPRGIRTWDDALAPDEVMEVGGMRVTTPARTAFDIACHHPVDAAVTSIDALARAARLTVADLELFAQRYPGHRNIRRVRTVFDLVDPGAESPRETRLRLLLIRAGFPRPTTQIPIYDGYGQLVAVVDMGWEDIRVAADYEGEHHRTDPQSFNKDIRRQEALAELGWIDVRVTKEDTDGGVIARVGAAHARRA